MTSPDEHNAIAYRTEAEFQARNFMRSCEGTAFRFVAGEFRRNLRKPSKRAIAKWIECAREMGFVRGFLTARTTPHLFTPVKPQYRSLSFLRRRL